jgi:hypothetical protein
MFSSYPRFTSAVLHCVTHTPAVQTPQVVTLLLNYQKGNKLPFSKANTKAITTT